MEKDDDFTDWLIAREECVMDLDDEELKATRKLNEVAKESNIEEDIKILERFKNNEMQRDKLERDNRCGAWKIGDIYKHLELNTAINHILAEREADKKKIKELEEALLKVKDKNATLFITCRNSIPKQKVKDKIKEIKEDKESKYFDTFLMARDINYAIKILEELLGDK